MDVILVPGFWLDASSWDDVVPVIEAAGHTAHALTLPGLESSAADRRGIRLSDHVEAVVAAIDAVEGPVAVVGHSGGGAIAYSAADARASRVARIVFVDAGPLPSGAAINDGEFPAADGELPLPDFGAFDPSEIAGLDEAALADLRARAIPEPQQVASDPQVYTDDARLTIPTTIIGSTMTSDVLKPLVEQGHPWVTELARIVDVSYIDLPTGHWPQFSRPRDLGVAIVSTLG